MSRSFDVVALGNSIGTGNKGLKAPVIMVESFEDLEKKRSRLRTGLFFTMQSLIRPISIPFRPTGMLENFVDRARAKLHSMVQSQSS